MEGEELVKRSCYQCGGEFKGEQNSRRMLCPTCAKKNWDESREKGKLHNREWRKEKEAKGLCTYLKSCMNPASPGIKACEFHRAGGLYYKTLKEHEDRRPKGKPQEQKLYDAESVDRIEELQDLFKKLDGINEELKTTGDRIVTLSQERDVILKTINDRIKQ